MAGRAELGDVYLRSRHAGGFELIPRRLPRIEIPVVRSGH
jgi:hypothetical protein